MIRIFYCLMLMAPLGLAACGSNPARFERGIVITWKVKPSPHFVINGEERMDAVQVQAYIRKNSAKWRCITFQYPEDHETGYYEMSGVANTCYELGLERRYLDSSGKQLGVHTLTWNESPDDNIEEYEIIFDRKSYGYGKGSIGLALSQRLQTGEIVQVLFPWKHYPSSAYLGNNAIGSEIWYMVDTRCYRMGVKVEKHLETVLE